jgi:hypothetical protein
MEISVVDKHSFGCQLLVVLELRKKVTTKYAGNFFLSWAVTCWNSWQ